MTYSYLTDPVIAELVNQEIIRQNTQLQLIASENFASAAIRAIQGSVLTNKYAEGYPAKRYYQGCNVVDEIENLAIERAKALFQCKYANVQPHSGSQANQAVFLAMLEPHDTILGMSLDCGGHLTHGAKPNLAGKWFNAVSYHVRADNYLIDYDEIEALALRHTPKLIIAGCSAYTRTIDFAKFKTIADKVGALFLADIAHIAGLVATGDHPSPFPHADIVTSTTHKTLRGPRGGLILTNNEALAKRLDRAVFPGLQGGALMQVIAAKAVAFHEALDDSFKLYSRQVIKNAQVLAQTLIEDGYQVLTGGTDNHMVILDLRNQQISGKQADEALSRVNIICNKNTIPFDQTSPTVTSGIRLGSPFCTTRGFTEAEFIATGKLISATLNKFKANALTDAVAQDISQQVQTLCKKFVMY